MAYDREEMAVKLSEWANKPDSLTILSFCAKNNITGDRLMAWARTDDKFKDVYNLAKLKVGSNRFDAQHQITAMEYTKNLRYYDPFYKAEMMEQSAYESGLKNSQGSDGQTPDQHLTEGN